MVIIPIDRIVESIIYVHQVLIQLLFVGMVQLGIQLKKIADGKIPLNVKKDFENGIK
jgi:hypothetical protein